MNHITTFSLVAAVTAALTQPLLADEHRGGGHPQNHAPARVSAPVQHAPAMHAPVARMSKPVMPKVAMHEPRAATQAQAQFRAQTLNPNPGRVGPQKSINRSIAQQNLQRQRNTPSIAFGGSVPQGSARMEGTDTPRRTENRAAVVAAQARDQRPPVDTFRNWDRSRVHEWNHRHFRWSGGDWVVIDGGGGFDTPDYYETAPADNYSYGSSGVVESQPVSGGADLTAQVQEQLSRRGYDPGPVDGVMGLATRDAIEDFQSAYGLPINGQIDSSLLQALGL